jgi:hypothetical protein
MSSDPIDRIFEFKLGPNLQNIGVNKWVLDLNENQWIFNFNNTGNDQNGPLKIPFDKADNPKTLFLKIFNGIASFLNISIKDKQLVPAFKDIQIGYTETGSSDSFKKFIQSAFSTSESESESESQSESESTITAGKRGGRGRKRSKDTIALSPSEIKDNKFKDQYRQDVITLRTKFENDKLTYNQWQTLVAEKYENLKNTVENNFPNAWEIMEFCLSIRCILNIKNNTLPFMGIILAAPSSTKTVILEQFRKTLSTLYLDQFTPQSLISNSSTKSEEELQKSDILPKMKDKLVITPELAPIFTCNEDELKSVMGKIVRLLDGKGFVALVAKIIQMHMFL